jgi:mannose-6-phosphate isomerase-like protein (cupin superfamily)
VAGRRKEYAWGRLEVFEAGARVQVKRLVLNPGARLSLPPHVHAVANDGDAPLEASEVQTGDHPGDEDPLRFADAPAVR